MLVVTIGSRCPQVADILLKELKKHTQITKQQGIFFKGCKGIE